MAPTSSSNPGAAVRGAAAGVSSWRCSATLWASIGIGGLQGWGAPWLWIAAAAARAAPLIGGISFLRASRRLSEQVAEADARHWRRYSGSGSTTYRARRFCLLAIVTLLVVPARIILWDRQIIACWSVVGFGSALILRATASRSGGFMQDCDCNLYRLALTIPYGRNAIL
jgi:hypothetical protein